MWVSVPEWMIVDEEPPLPVAGSVVRSVGVRVHGAVAPADQACPDEIIEAPAADRTDCVYTLTGRAGDATDVFISTGLDREEHQRTGAEFVLTVGGDRFQVWFAGRASDIRSGSQVTVTGRLELVGAYEWDHFALVDTRADWVATDVVALPDGGVTLNLTPVPG